MQSALSLGLVVAAGLTAMAGLAAIRPRLAGRPEVLRKAMHVVTGLLALALPWLFEFAWQALAATATGVLALCAAKRWPLLRRRLGGVVDGVARESHGEICFLAAVGALFLLVGDHWLLYATPLLVLTFADSAAALVGQAVGRRALWPGEPSKTVAGSLAFCLVAALCIFAPLAHVADMAPAPAAGYAVAIAALATAVEALSPRGYDNLTVPFCVLAAVRLAIPA